jgi:hypothetical protein
MAAFVFNAGVPSPPRVHRDDPARARDALFALDPGCPRKEWVDAAMAAKAAGLDADDFIAWSRGGGNFKSESDCRSVWRSISESGGIGPGTLFARAREAGWRNASPSRPANGSKGAHHPAKGSGLRQNGPQAPGVDAAGVWASAEPATPEHPYIARKLGLPDGLRVYRGSLRVAGQSLDGALLVPAFDAAGTLSTWQAIPAEAGARKLNAPGRPVAGTFTVGGALRDGEPAYLCEGVGAAWSAHQATGRPAVVAFGAGRMEAVARDLRERLPTARLVLVADVGKEADCERIAGIVGGSWVAPPADLGANGDVNDLHQRDGLEAVAALLEAPRTPTQTGFRAIPAPDFVRSVGTPEYVLDGILQRGFVYCMTGPTGAGKTAVALGLAACTALRQAFAGRETAGGPVLYVASENPDDVRARVLAWAAWFRVPVEELGDALRFVDESFVLHEREADLHATIEAVRPSLVILDTDQALAGSADENSNAERIAHAKRVRALSRLAGRPCVLDLCHPPAGAQRTSLRPRGGSAFLGEVDGNACLWRAEGSEAVELFRGEKFRGPAFEPLAFELRTVEVEALRDSRGRPMLSVVAVPTTADDDARLSKESRERLLAVLRSVSLDPDASQRQRADATGLPRSTVQRAIADLLARGAIKETLTGHEVTERGKRWLVAAL